MHFCVEELLWLLHETIRPNKIAQQRLNKWAQDLVLLVTALQRGKNKEGRDKKLFLSRRRRCCSDIYKCANYKERSVEKIEAYNYWGVGSTHILRFWYELLAKEISDGQSVVSFNFRWNDSAQKECVQLKVHRPGFI